MKAKEDSPLSCATSPRLTGPCFEEELRAAISLNPKQSLPDDGLTIAAVLAPLFSYKGECHVLLTRRSQHVLHHKGEISFPGGKLDECDKDFTSCALRETSEEIGVHPNDVRLLGELDDFYTVKTKYLVVPFVGVIPYPYDFRTSSREIAELLMIPLSVFFDPTNRSEFTCNFEGQDIQIFSYLWEGNTIWGATARILKHLIDLIVEYRRLEILDTNDATLEKNKCLVNK